MSSLLSSLRRFYDVPVEDAPLSDLPPSESTPLATLLSLYNARLLSPPADLLHHNDPWNKLSPQNLQSLCLRFLRYHLLNVDAALNHLVNVAHWRAVELPWQRPLNYMRGPAAGLPLMLMDGRGSDGEVLLYSPVRFYVKGQVDHASQKTAVKTFFEHMVYMKEGPLALSSIAVLDFKGMSMKNVDLVATKNGIRVFVDYYPELFKKIFVINYPSWLHGTWKVVKQLLDARTISKVVWVSDGGDLHNELGNYFARHHIPRWLGGSAPDGPMRLCTDVVVDADEVALSVQ